MATSTEPTTTEPTTNQGNGAPYSVPADVALYSAACDYGSTLLGNTVRSVQDAAAAVLRAATRFAYSGLVPRGGDPRVVEALAVFDRFKASPEHEPDPAKRLRGDILELFIEGIFGFAWYGWTDDAMRAMALAFLANAPSEDLDVMVAEARLRVEWHAEYLPDVERERAGQAVAP